MSTCGDSTQQPVLLDALELDANIRGHQYLVRSIPSQHTSMIHFESVCAIVQRHPVGVFANMAHILKTSYTCHPNHPSVKESKTQDRRFYTMVGHMSDEQLRAAWRQALEMEDDQALIQTTVERDLALKAEAKRQADKRLAEETARKDAAEAAMDPSTRPRMMDVYRDQVVSECRGFTGTFRASSGSLFSNGESESEYTLLLHFEKLCNRLNRAPEPLLATMARGLQVDFVRNAKSAQFASLDCPTSDTVCYLLQGHVLDEALRDALRAALNVPEESVTAEKVPVASVVNVTAESAPTVAAAAAKPVPPVPAHNMCVVKRSGKTESVSFDKILRRLQTLGQSDVRIDYVQLAQTVISQMHDGITTEKLDEMAAEQCASMVAVHMDFGTLASRIAVSNHLKKTPDRFADCARALYTYRDMHGEARPIITELVHDWATRSFASPVEIPGRPGAPARCIDDLIDMDREFLLDYFGFKTLARGYLLSAGGKVVERYQYLLMRVAISIHGSDESLSEAEAVGRIWETYDLMSRKFFIHATPTLFNAGTPNQQLSSCYLEAMEDDSITGIYNTLSDCAHISKYAGGVGMHIHNVRARGTEIRGTNGVTDGIVPMLRVFNNSARYVNQGGRRKGSIAVYLEPWHADIEDFLDMRKNTGNEDTKARDLFYALWVPDLFMQRVNEDGMWTLMCPHKCPGLADVHGRAFVELYESYERAGRGNRTMRARELWFRILDAQIETSMPYLMFKDACNSKSNQQNLGTIKSSNLCTEIVEYSDSNETAVCNLASIGLPSMLRADPEDPEKHVFDFAQLERVVRVVVRNLDRVIDINYYPLDKTRRSNLRHRPVGLGVQGLADVYIMMGMAFDSREAEGLNREIFETIYYASLSESLALVTEGGKVPYSSFTGSPLSRGQLQFDLWGALPPTTRYDWPALRAQIQEHGVRNSLLVALMPTASTSQILGFNECIEPITSNLVVRGTLAGSFIVVNKYLMKYMIEHGLWNAEVKTSIVRHNGSVKHLKSLPEAVRNLFLTAWEISPKALIRQSADRGPFVCQSQSLNLWVADPTYQKLTTLHNYSWKLGAKTGMYYLRREAKHKAQKFTVDPAVVSAAAEDESCTMCSA